MDPQGIIYACNPHPDFQKKVEELARRIPLVIISNKEKTTTVDAINQDNTMVGRLMARHLLDLGHRDVAFITPPPVSYTHLDVYKRQAELNAILKASKKLGDWRLEGCTMYVTLRCV